MHTASVMIRDKMACRALELGDLCMSNKGIIGLVCV